MIKNVEIWGKSHNGWGRKKSKQAGAELGQAQNKLGLDLALIFCRLGFSRFGLVELVGRFSFIGLIEKIWLIIYLVYIKHFDLV